MGSGCHSRQVLSLKAFANASINLHCKRMSFALSGRSLSGGGRRGFGLTRIKLDKRMRKGIFEEQLYFSSHGMACQQKKSEKQVTDKLFDVLLVCWLLVRRQAAGLKEE